MKMNNALEKREKTSRGSDAQNIQEKAFLKNETLPNSLVSRIMQDPGAEAEANRKDRWKNYSRNKTQ